MLGAKVLSLYGLDTDRAFGHLGLINMMGYADPERGISVGLTTSGKPIIYPEFPRFYGVMQTIASEIPKVPAARSGWSEARPARRPASAGHDRREPLADQVGLLWLGASTITRTSGSVPEARTRIRPRPVSASPSRAIAP